jgi:hypothetical protein
MTMPQLLRALDLTLSNNDPLLSPPERSTGGFE